MRILPLFIIVIAKLNHPIHPDIIKMHILWLNR